MTEPELFEIAVSLKMKISLKYEGKHRLGTDGKYYPYVGKADRKSVITIGIGHRLTDDDLKHGILINGERYFPYDGLTSAEVDKLFEQDTWTRIHPTWRTIGKKGAPPQVAAWLDLAFNCPSALHPTKSTPLKMHKAGLVKQCAEGIMKYTGVRQEDGTTKHYRGLFRRRGTDALLYYTGKLFIADSMPEEKELERLLKEAGLNYDKPKKLY